MLLSPKVVKLRHRPNHLQPIKDEASPVSLREQFRGNKMDMSDLLQ